MIPPIPAEYAPDVEEYVARVRDRDPFALLREQAPLLDRVSRGMTDEAALYRYEPGKWSIKDVIGHIVDSERVFAYRLLRIVRTDSTPLPGFDQDLYVSAASFDDRPLDDLVREFGLVRASTLALIDACPDVVWSREGSANGARVTARALLFIISGHVAHHFSLLAERYGLEGLRG